MSSKVFNEAKRAIAAGEIDLNAHDIRCLLVMSNSTVDTEQDAIVNVDDFTTLDEMDGANYVRKALANEAVNKDDANDRAEFDADDVSWTALGNGTRAVIGVLIYKHVSADSDHVVIAFIEFAASQNPGGANFTLTWNAEGILQLT